MHYLVTAKISLETDVKFVPLGEELGERLVLAGFHGVFKRVFKGRKALGGALENGAKELRVELSQVVRMDHQTPAGDGRES